MPALSALSYRRARPRVMAICAKHGVPYVQARRAPATHHHHHHHNELTAYLRARTRSLWGAQESVWLRLRKTVAVMVGDASMRPFPPEYEPPADRLVWSDQTRAARHAGDHVDELTTTHAAVAAA